MKYDLHIHTFYSKCSNLKPEVILSTAKKKGLNGIAITDHNTIKGALEVKKLNKDKNFEVIVGEEIKTDKGEILAYYLTKEIKPGNVDDVLAQIKKQNAICSIAHPFSSGIIRKKTKINLDKLASKIDAVETFNSRCFISAENERAKKLAEKFNLSETGGSDSHFFWSIGNGYTLFYGNLRKSVKSKSTKSEGKLGIGHIDRSLSLFINIWKKLF